MNDRRRATLRAAPGFLQFALRAPELQVLHRAFDTWAGIGPIAGGIQREAP